MALKRGVGGMATFTNVRDIDGNTLTTTIPVWAAATAYQIDDVVTVGTGADIKSFTAKITHTSVASDSTGSGATIGLNDAKWRRIEPGNITLLVSWSINETANTESKQILYEATARTVATTIASTGQIVFAFEDGDEVQDLFKSGNAGTLTIYRNGIGSKMPTITVEADISGRSEGGSDAIQEVTIDFTIDSPVVHGRTA